MSVEFQVRDEGGVPVVELTVTGTFDVSRLLELRETRGRVEDMDLAQRLRSRLRRTRGGRAALELLKGHGGPDLTQQPAGSGIFVTVRDAATDDQQTTEIPADDYVLLTVGGCHRAGVDAHANGTHVITVKGRRGL